MAMQHAVQNGSRPPSWRRWAPHLRRAAGAALVALAGCAPSEEEIRSEFAAYVSGANECSEARECAAASAECPLGCSVAVRLDRVESVERKARELVDEHESGGQSCEYDCSPPRALECASGRCAFAAQ